MKTHLAKIHANLAILDAFAERYPLVLPDRLLEIRVGQLHLEINAAYAPNEHGRLKILATVGDIFGRHDWMASEDYGNINWDKDILLNPYDSTSTKIHVRIYGAEKVEKSRNVPVPPQKFPVMLEDEKEEVADANYDPTPWCTLCGSMTAVGCTCPPPAQNE